jgi:hypothetical protein
VSVLPLTYHSRLTDDNMIDQFDEGLTEGILPQLFHPLYHIYVFETPRILRYRPSVERLRTLLSNTTTDESKRDCIAKTIDLTYKMNHVSTIIPFSLHR